MAITNKGIWYTTFHDYPETFMNAIRQIFSLLSDDSATTSDPRYEAYGVVWNMINNNEVPYERVGSNWVCASNENYSGEYNYLEIIFLDHQYDFYKAQKRSSVSVDDEVAKIKAGTQNSADKQEPVIEDPSKVESPSGKHYSVSDIKAAIIESQITYEEALIKLAGEVKYKKDDTIQVKIPADAITDNNKTLLTSSSGSSQQFSSDLDKKKNEQLAKEHPERVVDGVYYADDDALKKAKEAKEKRIKEETVAATTKAKANAEKLASTLSTIQKTLYGSDNSEAVDHLTGTVGGIDLNSALGDAASVRKRQKLLNFKTFIADYKEPSSGEDMTTDRRGTHWTKERNPNVVQILGTLGMAETYVVMTFIIFCMQMLLYI